MTPFASRARELGELVGELRARVRELRALMLVDGSGLPLVSTLGSGSLEDKLGAFGSAALLLMQRARDDFQMGPQHLLHVAGRDRQIFLAPVVGDIALMGIADAGASVSTLSIHLLALAREILEMLLTESSPEPEAGSETHTNGGGRTE